MGTEQREVSWPGWRTVRLIGQGSFGRVYEIEQNLQGYVEKAALKVISVPRYEGEIHELYNEGYSRDDITESFKGQLNGIISEYAMMRKLSDCPNIVNCDEVRCIQHDDGIGWDVYIKMELLTPLSKSLPQEISQDTVLKIAKDLCSALVTCRQHQIIHRDIKPQNIFVSSGGVYKLGDFGIAKTLDHTMYGTMTGTYKYMAPEVYHNQPYGSASDIYSLGMVLYWLLNERRMPFVPMPPVQLSQRQIEESNHRRLAGERLPPPKHGSMALKSIVMKACSYHVQDRYASAADMLRDLERLDHAGDEQITQEKRKPLVLDVCSSITLKRSEMAGGKQLPVDVAGRVIYVVLPGRVTDGQTISFSGKGRRDPQTGRYGDLLLTVHVLEDAKKPAWLGIALAAAMAAVLFCGGLLIWRTFSRPTDGNGASNQNPASEPRSAATEPSHIHSWVEATCTNARYCSACGEISGEPRGHAWVEASCASSRYCDRCGLTSGEPLAHEWQDATCTDPEKCRNCSATMGDALGHMWTLATFTAPKTCEVCGMTEGEPMDYRSIAVESEVTAIREIYNVIENGKSIGIYRKVSLREGVNAYCDGSGEYVCVVVYRGTEGLGDFSDTYSRSYYFEEGKLIFAFFEGGDSHRLYFYEEQLMRWRYKSGGKTVNCDFTFSDDFFLWEELALKEIETFD